MRVSEGFRSYVLEQLGAVPHLLARAMFGGVGLYADDLFFGIVAADTLYFKVDDRNRARYTAAGMAPFQPYSDRPMTMSYYQVPLGILEDPDELAAWAREAIAVASRAGRPRGAARKSRAR